MLQYSHAKFKLANEKFHAEMEQQHLAVQTWMEGLFGQGNVPEYEIRGDTLEVLQRLRERHERSCRVNSELQADAERKKQEYECEAARLSSVHQWIGISPDDLTAGGKAALEAVSQIAADLRVKDPSLTSLQLGLHHLQKRQAAVESSLKLTRQQLSSLEKRTADVKSMASTYDRRGKVSCEPYKEKWIVFTNQNPPNRVMKEEDAQYHHLKSLTDERQKHCQFLEQKSRQYGRQLKTLQSQLQSSGFDPQISYPVLSDIGEEIQAKMSRLESVNAQLDAYKDLPADIGLARLKLEEGKQELVRLEEAALEEELAKRVDLVHADR